MWTINNFPALGNLFGWNVYGKFACPSCNMNTCSIRLKYGNKFSFMGHQHFFDDLTNCKPPYGAQIGKMSDQATGVLEYTWKKRAFF